jgi:DNA-binding NtrC family response regulator
MIDKVAPTEARVLITGPNGTGKELVHQSMKSERLVL